MLAFLEPRELFSCRRVCRRFRDLGLHPHLWQSVRLTAWNKSLLCASLRLAPCIREVTLCDRDLKDTATAIFSGKCVITRLRMNVVASANELLATSILNVVSSLGGLRALHLDIQYLSPYKTNPLFRVVYGLENIHVLKITIARRPAPLSVSWPECEASLEKLHYTSPSNDGFLQLLLEAHATTLTEVRLLLPQSVHLPVATLTMMPQLRSFTCYVHDSMSHLLACSKLSDVHLKYFATAIPPGALEFLRLAPSIQSLTLETTHKERPDRPDAPILALYGSYCADRLKHLKLSGAPAVEPVADSFSFPSLESLTLHMEPSDIFLRAISPVTVPRLTLLELVPSAPKHWLHGFMHDPAVMDLLGRNPSLHLRPNWDKFDFEACNCRWCSWGCHSEFKWKDGVRRAFALHSRVAGCPKDCCRWMPYPV